MSARKSPGLLHFANQHGRLCSLWWGERISICWWTTGPLHSTCVERCTSTTAPPMRHIKAERSRSRRNPKIGQNVSDGRAAPACRLCLRLASELGRGALQESWHMDLGMGRADACGSRSKNQQSKETKETDRNGLQYVQGFLHPRWCKVSSINSSNVCLYKALHYTVTPLKTNGWNLRIPPWNRRNIYKPPILGFQPLVYVLGCPWKLVNGL